MVVGSARSRRASVRGLVCACLLVPAAALGAQQWQQAVPSGVRGDVMHDPGRNRTLLFVQAWLGRHTMWERSGNAWREAQPPHVPPFFGQPVYDLVRARTVLVGAPVFRGPIALCEYDGTTWTQITAANAPDSFSFLFDVVHDVVRAKVVLFGTRGGVAETWTCDGRLWTQLAPPVSPPPRLYAVMTYDLARAVTVLFGGQTSQNSSSVIADTWQFDGNTWAQVMAPTAPPARADAAMTSDVTRGRIVLFGGRDALFQPLADTWAFDGTTWTQQLTTVAPPGRRMASMTNDWNSGRTLLYGGADGQGMRSDTWEYDGVNWAELRATSPQARYGAAAVYDRVLGRVVMFGSESPNLNDTPIWNGVDWRPLLPSGSPSYRMLHAMAFDARRSRTVLYGGASFTGLFSETWSFDGANWSRLTFAAAPSVATGMTMAYDDDRDRIVLFGGNGPAGVSNETWEFDGLRWSRRTTTSAPPPRAATSMVYDLGRGRMVLFGGQDDLLAPLADTWEYDGLNWAAVATAHSPTPRCDHMMSYDRHRGRTTLFGGNTGNNGSTTAADDCWEYDGLDWTAITQTVRPDPMFGGRMVYDSNRQRHVLHGGMPGPQRSETWELLPPASATFARCGRGCPGSAGVPTLDAVGGAVPTLGTTLQLALGNLPAASGFAFLGVGFDVVMHQGAPLPRALDAQGLPSCLLWVSPALDLFVAHSGRTTTIALPVPNNLALRNLEVGMQAFIVDAAAPGGLGALSNGALLVLR